MMMDKRERSTGDLDNKPVSVQLALGVVVVTGPVI